MILPRQGAARRLPTGCNWGGAGHLIFVWFMRVTYRTTSDSSSETHVSYLSTNSEHQTILLKFF